MATTYRRRHNLLSNTLGAALATGATSITFGSALQEGGSNIATLGTDEYLLLTIENEIVALTAYTSGATTGTVVRAQGNTVDPGVDHPNGTAVKHAPTKTDFPSFMKTARRTSGDITTLNSTNWANVDTGLDLVLAAQAGDVIEYGMSANSGSQAVTLYLDVATIVGGSPVSSFAERGAVQTAPGAKVTAWIGNASAGTPIGGCAPLYTLVSGDISSGTVTLRLRYATSAATNKTVSATTATPLDVWARNLGPEGR